MKPTRPEEGDPPLGSVLSEWKVNASLPPRFQERVWQRIAVAEARPETRWAVAWLRWQEFLARPSLAAGYVSALLVLGFAVGWVQGLEQSARVDRSLSSRYVQVIDPYQGAGH